MPHLDFPAREGSHFSRNKTFLEKVRDILHSNFSNEQFGVNTLAEKMDMSRIQLYRKLQKLTGKNISQYIREFRLERAWELLKEDIASVSETAYQVGFGSPAYFNKCFHDFYGYTPGEVAKLSQGEEKKVADRTTKRNHRMGMKYIFRQLKKNFYHPSLGVILFVTTGIVIILAISGYFFKTFLDNSSLTSNQEKSIGVLPFHNDSTDPDNESICNGMMEEILTHLQHIESLCVKSRTSVERYRESVRNIKTIGKELNVNYLLEGSVRKAGDDLRIKVTLIEVKSRNPLWTETYNLKYNEEIFAFQSDLAKKIAASLQAIITPEEAERIEKIHSRDIIAWEYYQRGIEFFNNRDLELAEKLFDEALKIDPDYANAYAGKSLILVNQYKNDSAMMYAERALGLDPENVLGYTVIGMCYNNLQKLDLALKNYLKAVELDPKYNWANYFISKIYMKNGDIQKWILFLDKALKYGGDNQWTIFNKSAIDLMNFGEYEKAEKYLKFTLDLQIDWGANTDYFWLLIVQGKYKEAGNFLDSLGSHIDHEENTKDEPTIQFIDGYNRCRFYLYLFLKEYDQAEEIYNIKFKPKESPYYVNDSVSIGYLYLKVGEPERAKVILNYIHQSLESKLSEKQNNWEIYLHLSSIHAILNEKKEALKFLSEANKLGFQWGYHDFLLIDPFFENIRDDPDFKAIIKRGQDKKAAVRAEIKKMEERGEIDL